MLYFKKNVRIKELNETGAIVIEGLVFVSNDNLDMWITSANDSTHRQGSAHYKNRAFDIRTRHLNYENFEELTLSMLDVDDVALILFEWREEINGEWVMHSVKTENDSYYSEFEKYLNCKNKKVSHLHVEW